MDNKANRTSISLDPMNVAAGNALQLMVREFHLKYGQYQSNRPTLPPQEVLDLRFRLIAEESKETLDAIDALSKGIKDGLTLEQLRFHMVQILDGCCDSIYVLLGTLIALGLPFGPAFEEVHRSNMTKTVSSLKSPGDKYGTKQAKGPDFQAPCLQRLLGE